MNRMFQRTLVSLAAAALVWLPLKMATAQGLKPVAVVSIASVRENLNDIAYVTRAAGMEDQGEFARLTLSAMASGIDKDRPIGIYFIPKNDEFEGVAFIPLAPDGLKTILKMLKDRLGEPKDVGDGILKVGLKPGDEIRYGPMSALLPGAFGHPEGSLPLILRASTG